MNWTETYSQLNPKAQELYKRYASYRDKGMWKETDIRGGSDSEIDTKQWKADSGANAFYLSPSEYKQYDEWYKQEQAWKKEQEKKPQEETTTKQQQQQTQTTATQTPSRTVTMPQYAPPANFQYNPTVPVSFPTRQPSAGVAPAPAPPVAAPAPAQQPSVYTPQSAVPSNVRLAPLMSVSGADINSQVNSLLAQLAGLLSRQQPQQPTIQ